MIRYINLFNGLSGRADIDRTDEAKPSSEHRCLFLAQPKGNGGYRKMKKNVIIILFLGLLCKYNQIVICQNANDYSGKYQYVDYNGSPSDTTILYLQTNGEFVYLPFNISLISMSNCDSIKGKWTSKKKSIILNSDFQTKDYIKILSKYRQRDSVKIKFVRYPSGVLLREMDIYLSNNNDKTHSITKRTDTNGVIVVPKGYRVILFPFGNTDVESPKLKGGYYYQFTNVDCIPETFENEKLEKHGNTLIKSKKYYIRDKNRKNKKISFKSKQEYIKLNPHTQ